MPVSEPNNQPGAVNKELLNRAALQMRSNHSRLKSAAVVLAERPHRYARRTRALLKLAVGITILKSPELEVFADPK